MNRKWPLISSTVLLLQLVDGLVLWASVLEVLQVEKEDYGKYSCSAHNALGSDTSPIALNPPARPHPPTNFTVRDTERDDYNENFMIKEEIN